MHGSMSETVRAFLKIRVPIVIHVCNEFITRKDFPQVSHPVNHVMNIIIARFSVSWLFHFH